MNLSFNQQLAKGYRSKSQIARRLTEDWVLNNSYCPLCGYQILNKFENNRPVADFFCQKCNEEYELKSKKGKLTNTINDGGYTTMIDRVNSDNNPNFFFLTYSGWTVDNFLTIPKHFFSKNIIIKRPPLKNTAIRAGWIGCNIDISRISAIGKIFLVQNKKIIDPEKVSKLFKKTLFIRGKKKEAKGWILDILQCVDSIDKDNFSLDEIYQFESVLKKKYPKNNFIKDKIRQQLQLLRDKGMIEFVSYGKYKKVNNENI
ncbi:MAG: hypothetical protein ACD_79C01448G0002 [uncultured bacterium]|nr:MAG: hypothetical protein ACD_79C01448G0002 [uncultured bacterium]